MEPITREEYYLAKIAGTWQGKTPEPVTIEEYYLATMAGDYSGNTPQPVTRLQYYMAKAAGVYNGNVPAPVTRLEYYWAAIAGKEGHIPDPVTRQEYLLYAISQSNNDVINTVSGSTIIIRDATEGRPFRGLRVFGRTEQVRTTGAQLFDAKTFLKSQIVKGVVSINSDGKIVLNGVIDANNRAFTVTLQPGTYTLSADKPLTWHIIAPTDGIFNQKITVDVETTYNCYIANGTYNNIETTPMINVGSSALPWEPYTGGKPSPSPEYKQEPEDAGKDGSIEVKVGGRNLFDGKFESGSIRQDNGENQDYADRIRTAGFIQIKPSTVYSIKLLETISFSVRWYDKDKKFIKSEATNTISQSPDNARYMRFLLLTTKLDTKCMVYAGSAPTPYEPYRDPQTLTLQTPNGLPGVPVSKDGNYIDADGQQWICDEIDLGRGKYIERTIKITVDKETNLSANPLEKTKELRFYCSDLGVMSKPDIHSNTTSLVSAFCEHFKFQNTPTRNIDTVGIIAYAAVHCTQLSFRVPIDAGSDYFVNHPTTILAARERSIERDLTPEEITAYKALRTYGPTTVVSNDAGAGMEVTYVVER